MAERRMFTKKITDGDEFTSMPPTAQCLYFHLCMSADDDGFSNQIRASLFNAHATNDDFETLVRKRFIIPFESGVIVIKHWKMHNYIQNDRYHATKYVEEKSKLVLKENGAYTELDTNCIQNGYNLDTEVRLGKDRLDKSNNIINIAESDDSAEHKKTAFEAEFDEVWKLYPKKQGRQRALQSYIKARKNGVTKQVIEGAIKNYTEFCKKTNRYFADGSTWFNQARWEDDFTVYETTAQPREESMSERLARWRKEGLIDE